MIPSGLPELLSAPAGAILTMSSTEIADLTSKSHSHVVRDVKTMVVGLYGVKGQTFDEWERDEPDLVHLGKSVSWQRDTRGYVVSFQLDKEHSITLVAGYEVKLRKAIVDRWMKLEAAVAAPALPDLSDPSTLLRLLTEQAHGRIADQRRAAEAEAAAAISQGQLDCLSSTTGSIALRDAGKTLGFAKCDDIFAELKARHWIFKRDPKGQWIGHQDKCRAGYLDHEPITYTDRYGVEHTRAQVVVTPKGLVKLAEIFSRPSPPERPG